MKTIAFLEWLDRHHRQIRLLTLPLLPLMVIGVFFLVQTTGGIKFVYSHSMYLAILLGGFIFGVPGGLLTALAGGLALGPLTPIDVTTGEAQELQNWLYRLVFFVLIGVLSGLASYGARRYLAQLKWLSSHDLSTRLPNQNALLSRLQELGRHPQQPVQGTLVVLAIDNLHEITSAFGLAAVEDAVRQLAERIRSLAEGGAVYRIASNRIALLVPGGEKPRQHAISALVESSREPVSYRKVPIHLDLHIGYTVLEDDRASPEAHLQHAESALVQAQERAQECVAYCPEIMAISRENLAILGELKEALEDGQLGLHYQPKVHLSDGRVKGVEALLRWQHPERGMIAPEFFIQRAEQSTLINLITDFVLEEAIGQHMAWRRQGIIVPVAVNVSTRNLLQPGFSDKVGGLLVEHHLTGDSLELEVTEGALMTDLERTLRQLGRLADLSIVISIDDFGTGYSSLQYLHKMPVSTLKIDQSFVRRIPRDTGAIHIIEAAITLAHKMGIQTIAEGVETPAAYRFLQQTGCDVAQGFMVARPMTAEAFAEWYRANDGRFDPDDARDGPRKAAN